MDPTEFTAITTEFDTGVNEDEFTLPPEVNDEPQDDVA